jgi:uncharacterized membrane protein YphA (DoxX/SURF4 family)
MTPPDNKLDSVWWLLRISLGLAAFLAGLDKFFNLLTEWSMYLAPLAERMLPISSDAFFRVIGVVEMAVGLAILTRWTRIGAYVMAAWLVGIALNLVLAAHFWDLVVRDLELAISAFALARITEWRAATMAVRAAAPTTAPTRAPERLTQREART